MSRKKQRRPLKRAPVKTPKAPPRETVHGLEVPDGMTMAQFVFCLAYRANGFNASAAYREAHPGVTDGTARTEGHRTLANPNVSIWLAKHVGERFKRWEMTGEEAVARIGMDARADIRLCYGKDGKLLPIHEWPDEIVNSVRSFDGEKVTLNDSAAARRVIGEHTNALRNSATRGLESLAEILAAKLGEDE